MRDEIKEGFEELRKRLPPVSHMIDLTRVRKQEKWFSFRVKNCYCTCLLLFVFIFLCYKHFLFKGRTVKRNC